MADEIRFAGDVAVITGAGGGLGRAYAHMLGERGCRIVVNDVGRPHGDNIPAARSVVEELRVRGIEAIADDHDAITDGGAIIAAAIDAFGAVDIVVNNAGIGAGTPIGPNAQAEWRETIEATLQSSISVTGSAWPHLVERGGGRIVMTGSPAMFGASTTIPYSATKSSMYGFTRSIAFAGRRHGISANNVMPSALTRLTRSLPPGPMAELFQQHYQVEDVASFVAWLCHPTCWVSGESFSVGGGRAARVVLAENRGVLVDDHRPESWAAQIDDLLSLDEVVFPLSMNDEVTWQAHTLGKAVPSELGPGGALDWNRKPRP